MSRRTRWAIVVGVGIVLAVLAAGQVNERATGLKGVADLASMDPLQAAFNRDNGTPRLILLLSPT